jgi:hypothetical protein
MRHDPNFLSWLVRCSSPEEARRLQGWLAEHTDLDTTLEDVIRAYAGGVETQRIEQHRLGNYFEDIRILPGTPDEPSVFRVLFHRRPDAGRFWKDLMARILVSLRQCSSDVATTLDYKGDEDVVTASGTDR